MGALSLLSRIPAWVWVLLALLAWGGWNRHQAQSKARDAARAEQSAAVVAARASAEAGAREAERRAQLAGQAAADRAHARAQAAARDAAGARAELDRLRGILSRAGGVGTASATAADAAASSSPHAAPAESVIAECAIRLVEVAADADACGVQLGGLQDWIRSVNPPESP